MTAIELLKQGIATKNWTDIAKVYAMFTGETVKQEEPKKPGRPKKQPKSAPEPELVEVVESDPIDEYDVNNFVMSRNQTRNEDNKGEVQARREPINVRKIAEVGNMFTDEMNIATSDIAIDRKIVHHKVPKRPPPQQKIYMCQGNCGRKFKLFPSQTTQGKYKCVDCIKATPRS